MLCAKRWMKAMVFLAFARVDDELDDNVCGMKLVVDLRIGCLSNIESDRVNSYAGSGATKRKFSY